MGAFYGTQADKQRARDAAQREAQQAATARAAAVAAERQREAAWAAQPQRVVVDAERPWTAASSTYFLPPGGCWEGPHAAGRCVLLAAWQLRRRSGQKSGTGAQPCPLAPPCAEVEDAARRRAQREAAEANRAAAQRRAAAEAAAHAAEQAALRAAVAAEDTYFNRGANPGSRWVPPEFRPKQRAAAPAPAPAQGRVRGWARGCAGHGWRLGWGRPDRLRCSALAGVTQPCSMARPDACLPASITPSLPIRHRTAALLPCAALLLRRGGAQQQRRRLPGGQFRPHPPPHQRQPARAGGLGRGGVPGLGRPGACCSRQRQHRQRQRRQFQRLRPRGAQAGGRGSAAADSTGGPPVPVELGMTELLCFLNETAVCMLVIRLPVRAGQQG